MDNTQNLINRYQMMVSALKLSLNSNSASIIFQRSSADRIAKETFGYYMKISTYKSFIKEIKSMSNLEEIIKKYETKIVERQASLDEIKNMFSLAKSDNTIDVVDLESEHENVMYDIKMYTEFIKDLKTLPNGK